MPLYVICRMRAEGISAHTSASSAGGDDARAQVLAAVSFEDDDVADGEFFSEVCGFEIWADSSGHGIFHNEKRGANNFISNWNIRIRLHSDTGSYFLVDAGPDMLHRRAGIEYSPSPDGH